jgi:hypothetical protein
VSGYLDTHSQLVGLNTQFSFTVANEDESLHGSACDVRQLHHQGFCSTRLKHLCERVENKIVSEWGKM